MVGKQTLDYETIIVGVGASAGGIQALKVFFEHVTADSGIAYVVILHLSPHYESQLPQYFHWSPKSRYCRYGQRSCPA